MIPGGISEGFLLCSIIVVLDASGIDTVRQVTVLGIVKNSVPLPLNLLSKGWFVNLIGFQS